MTIESMLSELVQIPSVNPLQAGPKSGDGGEVAMANWLGDHAESMGADVTLDEVLDGRPNVYAHFAGDSDRTVTVDVHLDTVGVEHMTRDPFDGAIEDGKVFGRGSVDTKATLAVVLTVLAELRAAGTRPIPTVNLVGTVAEEAGGLLGAGHYRRWLRDHGQRVNQMVVAEPTMCAPVHGHKGAVSLEVHVHGHAAHSSKPHLGTNAISAAARVVLAIDQEQQRLANLEAQTPVGNGTVSVTEIEGGTARNIIPASCDLFIGRRTVPEDDPQALVGQLSELVNDAAAPAKTDIEVVYGRPLAAFYQEPDSELVQALGALAGTQPDTADYGSNALMYAKAADQIVVFGPGSIDQAHQAVEWIEIEQLYKAADVYRAFFG